MAANIFIDTSIFLSFYSVSNDDLEQLEKLVGLIAGGEIVLFVTAQVEREWVRNRDNKLSAAIDALEKVSFKLPSIPRFMIEYPEISAIRRALLQAEKARSEALVRAKDEASTATTNADKLIQRIFTASGVEGDDENIFRRAQRRLSLGDPPGKPESIGDRLNWEHLLAADRTSGDIHIISRDADYFSPLDKKLPKYALVQEWFLKKKGRLFVHHELKPFLTSHFPQFKFKPETSSPPKPTDTPEALLQVHSRVNAAWDARKHAAIQALEDAESVEEVEEAINKIQSMTPLLTESDLLRLCRFSIESDLIHDHVLDGNITGFFEGIIPLVYHLFDKKEIDALEMTFNLELHPEEIGQEDGDHLAPNYGQMDLDLLETELDDEIKAGRPLPPKPRPQLPPYWRDPDDDIVF